MRKRNPTPLWGGLIALVALATLLLAGCGGGGGGSGTANDNASAKAGGTLKIAEVEEVTSFVPTVPTGETSIHMIGQIMEPLIRTNTESELEPWLAESYKPSNDRMTWTFELRDGVEFSNGKPLTADDVVFSLETLRKSAFWSFIIASVKEVKATSPSTVVIELKEPDSALLAELSIFSANIVPENYGGMSEKEFAQKPIGTGPFILAEWKHGQSLTLAKNPSYWRQGEPLLDEIVAYTVTEANSRMSQLRGGQLDAALAPPFAQLESLEQTPGYAVGEYAWALLNTVQLSANAAVFEDPRAREAVNLALDREGIIDAAASGYGKPAGSWVPSSVPYWNPDIEPTQQDIPQAKKLLAEAVADGTKPSFTMHYSAGNPYWTAATQLMQQDLEEVGFDVTLRPLDISALTEVWLSGEYEAIAWSAGKPDIPDQIEFIVFYTGTNALGTGAPLEEVEKLQAEIRAEYDPKKLRQLYYRFQELVDEERYFLTLDEQQFIWGTKDNIVGLDTNLTGKPTFSETGFSD